MRSQDLVVSCCRVIRFLLLAMIWFLAPSLYAELPELIQQAGDSDDDHVRQSLLAKMAALPTLDDARRKEAIALADFSQKWVEGGLKFYSASMRGKPYRALGDYDFGVAADSPLRPLCELYRGRMLAWNLIENSNVRTNPKEAKWFKDEAAASFQRTAKAFPLNKVASMYLGEALPWGTIPEKVDGAKENWWEPVDTGGFMHSYYIWPSVITEITDALMLAHVMTGKDHYLNPLRSMAAIRLRHLKVPSTELMPGTEPWCADQLAPRKNAPRFPQMAVRWLTPPKDIAA